MELPEESYDALTMWHALEHVPSPMATLRCAWKLLRPGGRLLVALPRFDCLQRDWFGSCWFPLDLPRHLTHFTKATLHRHLETAGFQIEKNWPVRRGTVIRRSFNYLAKETGKPLYASLAKSHIIVGLMNGWCLLHDGKTAEMICVARKP
jgi:ubiquinone/menaquinone biosynthesis C-methylase UbiE